VKKTLITGLVVGMGFVSVAGLTGCIVVQPPSAPIPEATPAPPEKSAPPPEALPTPPEEFTITITLDGPGEVLLTPLRETYPEGTEVVLTATPEPDYQFDHWGGDTSGSDNPIAFEMDSNKVVMAYFKPVPCELIIDPLIDEETGKPIGRVDGGYVRVILDGLDRGYVTDYGELLLSNINPGMHELMLVVPGYGEVTKLIELEPGETEEIETVIDMPNPVFMVAIEAYSYWDFGEYGHIEVTLTNKGNVDSVDTSVLVLVYTEDDPTTPIATKIMDFGNVAPGALSTTKEWHRIEPFVWGPREIIAVAVFDRWSFTPENEKVISQIAVPQSMMEKLASSVSSYLEEHPEVVVNIVAKVILAWIG